MKRQIKKTILATIILAILVISQAVSAAPLHPAVASGPGSQFVYDNFNDNYTDPSLWSVGQQGGPTASETDQRLEITIPGNSTGEKFAAAYYSACLLHGDFDIQVDYALLTWPLANGVRVSLSTTPGNMERVSFGTQPGDFTGGPEVYLTDFAGYVSGITPTSDYSGKLRLVRTGETLTGLYFANGTWASIWSHSASANDEDTGFGLASWSHDPVFTDQEVKLGFDNMIINAGELVCPPVDVMIEIRPDGVANRINPRSKGLIPVAILTTDDFDANSVDASTVSFGVTGTEAAAANSSLEDVDGDGDTDLLLYFNLRETGIQCGDMEASLVGETLSGRTFAGSDNFVTVGCKDR